MITVVAKSGDQSREAVERLRAQVGRMQASLAVLRAQAGRLRLALEGVRLDRDRLAARLRELERLQPGYESLVVENEQLRAEVVRLQEMVTAAQRASRRQAAPFSKNNPTEHPRRAGRRAGRSYGKKAHRQIPEHIDETLAVPLPGSCPHCGGQVAFEGIDQIYQSELPVVVPIHRRFDVHRGHCRDCGRAVRGRHPDQASDALGAAPAIWGHGRWAMRWS